MTMMLIQLLIPDFYWWQWCWYNADDDAVGNDGVDDGWGWWWSWWWERTLWYQDSTDMYRQHDGLLNMACFDVCLMFAAWCLMFDDWRRCSRSLHHYITELSWMILNILVRFPWLIGFQWKSEKNTRTSDCQNKHVESCRFDRTDDVFDSAEFGLS